MSDKKQPEKEPDRSRWATDDDENDPSSDNNRPLTPAEMQAAMAAADCGTARQHQLSTAIRRDERPVTTSQSRILASRDCNVDGSEAARNAQANQAKLKGWGNVASYDTSDDDGKKDIAGGQTHRLKLRQEVRKDDSEEVSRLSSSGDARGLHGPSRTLHPARHSVKPPPRTAPRSSTANEIVRDTTDQTPLTDAEWQAIKRIYDEHKIPRPSTASAMDRAVQRDLLYKSRSQNSTRPGAPQPARPARPARPVNNAWAPQNLVVNPTPPLNLSNPSVTTSPAEMRRRLGEAFIETEPATAPTPTTPEPAREPVATRPNPFDLSVPTIVTLEKEMVRNYGTAGVETAAVEASIASARETSPPSNPFNTPSPAMQPVVITPGSIPDGADEELLELVDGKLKDFHITRPRRESVAPSMPSIPEEEEVPTEGDLMDFEEEAPRSARSSQSLLDTTPERSFPAPLEPVDAVQPSTSTTTNEAGTQTEIAATPAAIAAAHTTPLAYMGDQLSAFHRDALQSSDAFWAQQERRRQAHGMGIAEREPAPAQRGSSLNASRWAPGPASHKPSRNDSA
ncbi:hypothetical protein OHC33_002779 [Knufia fluminis]|uniref:Uncharacterized protein n=1 Tax=Knufia fluminis TaxID=191047 RepID=A0AAN8EUI8_9EURO|nr:hypothetical protein OHC33_002779 [Knufia fluminis]